jgi:hypothetical protein
VENANTHADDRMRDGKIESQEEVQENRSDCEDDDSHVTASTKGAACLRRAKLQHARR